MKTKTIWAIVIVVLIIAIIIYFYNKNSDKKRYGGTLRQNKPCSPACPRGTFCNTITGECKPPTERAQGGACSKTYTYTDVNGVKHSRTCSGYYNANEDCVCSGYDV